MTLTEPASRDTALETRIGATVDNWKRKLLDLTKRNRLLSFRANRVTTITVVDELPGEVFRRLYVAEQPMRFAPTPDSTQDAADAAAADRNGSLMELLEPDDAGDTGSEFVAYPQGKVEARHADEWLQTTFAADQLDRSLRRIDEQARLTLEEQGVNTLFLTLGMLHYTESRDSDEVFRAPLVMLPVELSRKTARSGYEIRVGDDEVVVNPALAEHLRRSGFNLPVLPDSDAIGDDYDLQSYFVAVMEAIADQPKWSVRTDIYLGLFSFQKFVMFKDLEANVQAVGSHRLTRQLISRAGGTVMGLPDDVRRIQLDEEFPPESSFQVVDADSSQLRAIAACARGHDLVIEGPPGTGKSQTITNLIAQALADGKSVLFVAEKMAALSVVHERLNKVGLGEFCLELHSSKANKRSVMQDLANTIDASNRSVAGSVAAGERLPQVRADLTAYAEALHEPFGALGVSPYTGFGRLEPVRQAPSVTFTRSIDQVTRDELNQVVRDLGDFAAAAGPVGVPAEHPWRDSGRTFYSELDLEAVAAAAAQVQNAAAGLLTLAAETQRQFGVPPVERLADVANARQVGDVLARSPGASLEVLQSESWNTPPAAAASTIALGKETAGHRAKVERAFTADVLEQEHAGDIAFMQERLGSTFGFLSFLNPRYRAVRKRWLAYRRQGYSRSLLEQADELKVADRLRACRVELRSVEEQGRQLFGELWQGERSDWDALDAYVQWVVEFRKTCVRHGVEQRTYELATQPTPDTSRLDALQGAADEYRAALERLAKLIEWPEGYLADIPVAEAAARVKDLAGALQRGPEWAAFERTRQAVADGLAAELLPAAMSGALEASALAPAFLRAFYMRWLSDAVRQRPPLERFQSLTHEQRVREFQELDRAVLAENRLKLTQQLRDAAQDRLREPEAREGLPHLQRQMTRQRGIAPLRRTMQQSGAAIRAVKPCFMMSPMTVAQMLPGQEPVFDLVIFDEASQMPTEDAVGAVIRGRQLVVVGDPKQLPPTNFFAVASGQVVAESDEDGNPLFDDSESILEEFMGAGVPMSRLKWHYRSAHESLITYSNIQFYDADLYTFPSVDASTSHMGLQFEFVDGRYEGKGLNAIEARRVSEEVVRFAREQLAREARGDTPLTLGIGTFNMRQQLAIQDELERLRRSDPSIEPFFDRGAREPFFVKNLENIQGDERDVIFLSVTYGPGTDGRIRYNFGPLNGANGWRRLNVLVTRARQRMKVFSSMRGDQISPTSAGSDGPRLLREFLTYAEHGRLDSVTAGTLADTESPFEREVARELMQRGIRVLPQVGSSGYRIDLGVLADDRDGRFVCGIECDGVAYHSSETARDRDRLRQQVLEARGWTIVRVWSTDWFKDRSGQVSRLLRLIEDAKARVGPVPQPPPPGPVPPIGDPPPSPEPSDEGPPPYRRPVAAEYVRAAPPRPAGAADILNTQPSIIARVVRQVVDVEAPVHIEEVFQRVAAVWGTRVGSRVRAHLDKAARAAAVQGGVRLKGDFFWTDSETCRLRSRAVVRMPAERIPREEYEQAILAVLEPGHSFPRAELIAEVRAVLGFSRTGALLERAIGDVLDEMVERGAVGEGSAGLRLRESTV